jgi:hypothetical protein
VILRMKKSEKSTSKMESRKYKFERKKKEGQVGRKMKRKRDKERERNEIGKMKVRYSFTVKPPNNGHSWSQRFCPLLGGIRYMKGGFTKK